MVLLLDAAVDNGLLDALPGSAEGLAADLGLDPHATGVVLDGLASRTPPNSNFLTPGKPARLGGRAAGPGWGGGPWSRSSPGGR
jgi:hypothetical protein